MKIPKINNRKYLTKPILFFTIIAVIVTISVYYLYVIRGTIFSWSIYPSTPTSTTEEQNKNGQQIKSQSLENSGSSKITSGSDQPPSPTQQSDGKNVVEIIITAVNQTSVSLQIRLLISTLDSNGVCTLALQNKIIPSSVITLTSGAQAMSNTSTCKGFDIPINEITKGDWQATINYETTTLKGSATKLITIE